MLYIFFKFLYSYIAKMERLSILILVVLLNVFVSFSQENDNMGLGNPSKATTDITNAENYLMVKPQYCLSYSNSKHIPNWVSWHLGMTDLGVTKRKNNFHSDSTLPPEWYHVSSTDYSKTGFDRGHMCPSADRTASEEDNSATFLMTNMVPQASNNNRITCVY
jgi:endonuclease G, mitochondrial